HRVPFVLAVILGAVVSSMVAAAVGTGALRVRGLLLAISTMAFAIAAEVYIFPRPILVGTEGSSVGEVDRGKLGPVDLTLHNRAYYFFALGTLVIVLLLVGHLRRTGIGRAIVGVRENEAGAAAFTVSPRRAKLTAFALAGFLAGLGGAVLAGTVQTFGYHDAFFRIQVSLARRAGVTMATNVDGSAIATSALAVDFGGLVAVDSVEFHAMPGEVVGLIGTNGAGKSTLLNAIGGYVPSRGKVELLGDDVSRFPPHLRARAGLGRTFQAATLFPELTVRETVLLALEARGATSFWGSLLFYPPSISKERARRAEAAELIDFLGLGRYADRFIVELSTGTRRIVEFASVLAVAPRVVCLDEPTAGVAQREAEAFGPLIKRVQRELDATLV